MGKALYLRGWLFIRSFVRRHAGDSSDVTLAFEDAQVIQPFSREETDDTVDTDDTDDTDDTYDTDDTDDTESTESTASTAYFLDTF